MQEFMTYFTLAIACLLFGSALMWSLLVFRRALYIDPVRKSEEFMMSGIPDYARFIIMALVVAVIGLVASYILPNYPEGSRWTIGDVTGMKTESHLIFDGNFFGLAIPAVCMSLSTVLTFTAFIQILAGGHPEREFITTSDHEKDLT